MNPISLLKAAVDRQIDADEFLKHLWALSTGMNRTGRKYSGSKQQPIRMFRSRIFKGDSRPAKSRDCSYPPAEFASLGRANPQGESVFYASAGGPTTFVESRCSVGDVVIVSEFRLACDLLVQEIGFENSGHKSLEAEYEVLLRTLFMHPGPELYEYTSRIAKHLMGGEVLHGILYPSIESANQSQNLALKPSFIDDNAHLANATAFEIQSIHSKHKYDVQEVDFATCDGENLSWKGRKKRWTAKEQGQQLKMVATGWSWDAFDETDNLIDPE